jgi:hypothetical protein
MRSTRYLSRPSYFIGGLLIVLPTIDFVLSVSPMRLRTTSWRFGAEGILPRALLTPVLGLLMWFVTAWLLEQRVMLRIVAAISSLAAAVLTLIAISFALDSVQMKAQVAPAAATAFMFTVAITVVKDALFVLAGLILAHSSWKCARQSGARDQDASAAMLIREPARRAGAMPTPS